MARVQTATQTGAGSTRWIKLTSHVTPFSTSVQVGLGGGTASYRIEVTLDETDPTPDPQLPGAVLANRTVTPIAAPGTVGATADGLVAIQQPVSAVRVTVDSGTATVNVRVLQAGLI